MDILRLINLRGHPNIVALQDFLEDENYIYFVMELCEGKMLFDHINDQGRLDETMAAHVVKEVVGAVEACHAFGITHRDIKLENLMLKTKDPNSSIKVIDFGLAQYFEGDEVLTDGVGTPLYMAPEVMEGHHGPKADIWSVGVVLYALLSGSYPFNGSTIEEIYGMALKCSQLFVHHPTPHISECAKDLIGKMLKYNPSERLSASEVLKHPWIVYNAT